MEPIRIIPCLDVAEGRVVKGVNFVNLRDMGDPVELAQYYEEEGADELVFLDISATHEGRKTQLTWVQEVAKELRIPFCVGGGVNSVESARQLLDVGVDKVAVNSAAIQNPELVRDLAEMIGSQSVVVAVDAKRSSALGWEVFAKGGREATGIKVLDWVAKMEAFGAGEILLTSMDGDGTKAGFDNQLYAEVRKVCNLPLIASGGAGQLSDFKSVISEGGVDAVLAASLFHSKQMQIIDLKKYLVKQGLVCRVE